MHLLFNSFVNCQLFFLASICMFISSYLFRVFKLPDSINERAPCCTHSTVFAPMFVINVLLSGLTVSEGGMRRDEKHSSLLIYWLLFAPV